MTYDGPGLRCFIFVLIYKFGSTAESNLRNIFFNFIGSHTNTFIADWNGFGLLVYRNFNGGITQVTFYLAKGTQCLQFLSGINSVADQLA